MRGLKPPQSSGVKLSLIEDVFSAAKQRTEQVGIAGRWVKNMPQGLKPEFILPRLWHG
jgi:hypothetical protein